MDDSPISPPPPPDDEDQGNGKMPHAGPFVSIEREMRVSYLDYAMSVIVSRAIPDLRDGLKPVHRRILYAMYETGNTHDKAYRKSARPVGDVMGKYHPHGDAAIYDALVRMAQDFSMSLPLLDGQGNFGSLDGDNPAAMRYTEVRMERSATALLADIEKDTVDFQDNYDGKDREPSVLPARFPNILVNGANGIAVGMATNIPPHNLGEICTATLALIEQPDLADEQLLEYVPGPDFPTGGVLLGRMGARRAYLEGQGKLLVRAKTRIETLRRDRYAIVVDEVPYQVNKAAMIEKIAEAARDGRVEGVAHVQDESDRNGVRVVIELKRDAAAEVVQNQLFQATPMQSSVSCNLLALNGGRPERLSLRGMLGAFITFREQVVARRTAYDLRKARERSHILCGLAVAVANVDEVVATIRGCADAAEARRTLMARAWPVAEIATYIGLIDDPAHRINADGTYHLSETQARAILDLRLQRLTQLGVREVTAELEELANNIRQYLDILGSPARITALVAAELRAIRDSYAIARRTAIIDAPGELEDEDLIECKDMVVAITAGGYIKRTPLAEFRTQRRGGKGLMGMQMRADDAITTLFVATTHTQLLFFTTHGLVYKLKTWRLPQAGRTARGRAMVNILHIPSGVSVATTMPIDRPEAEWDNLHVVFATTAGHVRRNSLRDFIQVNRKGKIAMELPPGVEMVNVRICSDSDDIMLITAKGRAVRFPATEVRCFKGRKAKGVRGIRLAAGDKVVSMSVVAHFAASPQERSAYLKLRRAKAAEAAAVDHADEDAAAEATAEEIAGAGAEEAIDMLEQDADLIESATISPERYAQMCAAESLILTITADGKGKLSSSHDYPVRGRGGKGVAAMDIARRGGALVASFPVALEDQVMLATSTGQSIRVPVAGISFRSRTAGGVHVLRTAMGEKVVSVARIPDQGLPDQDDRSDQGNQGDNGDNGDQGDQSGQGEQNTQNEGIAENSAEAPAPKASPEQPQPPLPQLPLDYKS